MKRALYLVAVLAAGCASAPPIRFYTLSAIKPDAAAVVATSPAIMPIRVERVTIPAELDRNQLVRRLDATQLELLENDRWAAPLDDMIKRVLSDDLRLRLPAGAVVDPNEPGDKRQQSLAVDIRELYGDTSCAVVLRATWQLGRPDGRGDSQTADVEVSPRSPCTDAALAPAMSAALAELSDRVAAALARSGPQPD